MARDWCNEEDPTNKKVLEFIKKYKTDAEKVADKLGVPVEFVLGLSATESGYGTSKISRNAKNFFGQNANASGKTGVYITDQNAKVAVFDSFSSSAESFARDFGKLIKGKKTADSFVKALVPKFNTAESKTNGNPKFVQDTKSGILSIVRRIACLTQKTSHPCGAKCENFEKYGYCDRATKNKRCWQHS